MTSRRSSTTSDHLALMQMSVSLTNEAESSHFREIETAPIFTSRVLHLLKEKKILSKLHLPQYGLLGKKEALFNATDGGDDMGEKWLVRESLLYANTNAPWSAFICGSQGSGKSHTLSCLLENYLLSFSPAGDLPSPLTGIVFHYDKFTGHNTTQLCEAAYLCSAGIPVRVLVSPTNIWKMQKMYGELPGLPKGAPKPQVLPLRFKERQLNCNNLKTLMAVKGGPTPLYLAVLNQLLRDIAFERQGEPGIDYEDFKSRLEEQGFTDSQKVPLSLRLQLLESFLDISKSAQKMKAGVISDIWNFEPGSLTIVDLSCPFVDEDDACALFNIALGLFLESRSESGRVVALDEAHKFLTKSGEAEIFNDQLLSIIRQQRHLGARVLIATQEPTLSTNLIDLCNVTIVHRFVSPAWFSVLKDHLAGAGGKSSSAQERIFRSILELKTGEALLFSPTSIMDITDEKNLRLKTLDDSYIKMTVRNRITEDGGKSIMASAGGAPNTPPARIRDDGYSNKEEAGMSPDESGDKFSDHFEDSHDVNILTAELSKAKIPPSSDDRNFGGFSDKNEFTFSFTNPMESASVAFDERSNHFNQNPRPQHLTAPIFTNTNPIIPAKIVTNSPPRGAKNVAQTVTKSPPKEVENVAETVTYPPSKKAGKVALRNYEEALRSAAVTLYRKNHSNLFDFGTARKLAAKTLGLDEGFFDAINWKKKSKEILKGEVERQVARSGLPPPKGATWITLG